MSKRRLTREDEDLWSHVARTARPLKQAAGTTVKKQGAMHQQKVTPPESGEQTMEPQPPAIQKARSELGPALDLKTRRRVTRGNIEVDGRLDLHGMNQERAFTALAAFLRDAQADGKKLVLVITGKGYGGDGVLRRAVPGWLSGARLRRFVVGLEEAGRRHGGGGALYVSLRRLRP